MINNNNNSNNSKKENKQKIDKSIYYLSYFLTDKDKKELELIDSRKKSLNIIIRDKNKIKKYLIPLLTLIVENENFNKDNLLFKKSFSVIISKKYKELPDEFKEEYLNLKNRDTIKEQKVLEEKINKSFEEAKIFLRDFRNIMMHKNVKEDTFSRFDFDKFDGKLFSFLRICLKAENKNNLNENKILENKNLSLDKANFRDNYIDKVLKITPEEMKKNVKNVPFIYALIILAMFTESKYIKELLDLIKVKMFVKDIVASFSLRGGHKILVSGIPDNNKKEELYLKQIDMSEEITEKANVTGKRIIKDLNYFDISKEKININSEENIYKNILRFYGYGNSFPKIEELEDNIRKYKAKEIEKANKNKIEGIKQYNQNARKYNNSEENQWKQKLAIQNENKNLETDYEKIIPTLNNVFRNEDIFMKEAIEFLKSKYKNIFGDDTWSIADNAVIWLEPNENVMFDLRKRVKPSKNGMNSIYKIVYNKENADRYSLNRYNLIALITSVLIKGGLSFEELKNTATDDLKPKKNNANTNNLAEDLKNKIPTWNRHKQASLIVKTVRKSIIGDIHLHNVDSVSFYQNFMRILYRLDNKVGSIYGDAIDMINTYGIPTKNVGEEISKLLKHDNLQGMALSSADILVKFKKKKEVKQSMASFKTWSKFAFAPVNEKNENIYKILGWNDIKNNLNLIKTNENNRIYIFEILYNHFNKNNITLPPIVSIYENYIKDNNKIKYYRAKEIRSIIAEEMILYLISNYYIEQMPSVKDNKKYFYFESYIDEKEDSPFKFNLVWNLNPKIKINIKDYMKRDVRHALDYIFDSNRIKDKGKINGKEDLQNCLESCLASYDIITNHVILKSKCPKPNSIIKRDILNADNIKDIVKVLIWVQKELLYFICNIESDIIYTLYNTLGESQMNNLKEDGNYFNFFKLIEAYNQNIESIKSNKDFKDKKKFDNKSLVELNIIRKMLAHGRLIDKYETKDKHENINYSSIISILDTSLKNIFNKNLADSYANKNSNSNYENGEGKKDYKNNNKFNNKNKKRRKNR